jgi:Uma2 family endonuclease
MSVRTLLTAEDFLALPDVPGKRFELVRGKLIEVSGATALHGEIVELIHEVLKVFVRLHHLGRVYGDSVAYIVAREPDIVRVPDVSFVARDRVPATGIPDTFWPFAPDLAVEVVSANDRVVEVRKNVREYLDGGTRAVWVAWPATRSIEVRTSARPPQDLGSDDELDGGDVLPGFRVRVADLFDIDIDA